MTEKEQEILALYLKDLQKKRLIIAFIIICVIIIGGASAKKYLTQKLLKILNCNKQKRINQILQDIEENNNFDTETKKNLYEEIFGYVEDTNNYLKTNLKEIFTIAAKETIVKINNEIMKGRIKLSRKIKIIIADDNIHICKFIKEFL